MTGAFEDLTVGERFRHWPGRTITEFDDTWFSLMCMNQHPLHIDEHHASQSQHGRRLVVGPLVISIVIGMSQSEIGAAALRTLEYSDVRHIGPVFHGDTIYAESQIVDKEESDGAGVVTIESTGFNQRGEVVLSLRRKIVLSRRTENGLRINADERR